jgi:hypothetical protein
VKITKAGQEALELQTTFEPQEGNKVYSLVIVGLIGNETTTPFSLVTVTDDNSAPATSLTSRIRFINAVAGETLKVDVYFNDQGPIFPGVDYKEITAYTNIGIDSYRVDIFEAGSTTNHLLAVNYQVVGGQVVTLIVEGTQNQTSVQTSTDKSFTYFQLRVAHTSPDAGSVDISVDQEKVWVGLEFNTVTSYHEFTSDKNTVFITSHTNGTILLHLNQTFAVGKSSSLILVGLAV